MAIVNDEELYMTIRQTTKAKYTKELKMLRLTNGELSHGQVWDYTKNYIWVVLCSTHKDLTGKSLLSKRESFTYHKMVANPALASVFWKEVGFINSIWDQIHPMSKNKKKTNLPVWKLE